MRARTARVPPGRGTGGLSRPTVLVIEDELAILNVVRECLQDEGYEVVGWTQGTRASDVARAASPAVIVLDLALPGKHGREVLRELRSDPATRPIPVVITSAAPEQAGPDLALADATLPKPYDLTALLDAVGRCAARRPPARRRFEPAGGEFDARADAAMS